MRCIIFLILLYFLSALQSSHLGGMPYGSMGGPWPSIEYLPLLAVFYAMFAAEAAVPFAALACGVMYDITQGDPIGTTMIPLALVMLMIVRIRLSIFREHVVSQMLLTLVALLALAVMEGVFRWGIGASLEGRSLWTQMGRMAGNAFYTALLSPVFFWVFFRFKQSLGFTEHGSRARGGMR